MKLGRQTTLRKTVVLFGKGVHSNRPVTLQLHPADANSGVVFVRTDLDGGRERHLEAKWHQVSSTELCTVLGSNKAESVSTVEHLLAAFAGLGLDNVLVEIDGAEVPIMDGSAAVFVQAIDRVGLKELPNARRYIRILKPVRIEQGRSYSELLPSAGGFRLEVAIDFDAPAIGAQNKSLDLTPRRFRTEISRARTFGRIGDLDRLTKMGLALGSSLENSIGVDGDRILNPEGLRFKDEFVAHKMLDAIGDLALAGAPLIGTYRAFCPGHRMNYHMVEALFADRTAWQYVEAPRSEPIFADFGLATTPAFSAAEAG